MDGKKYTVTMDIRRTKDGDRFYMHDLQIEKTGSHQDHNMDLLTDENQPSDMNIPQPNDSVKTEKKFSLKEVVEETDKLIALHNLDGNKLEKALELGGFPMPSYGTVYIAIMNTIIVKSCFCIILRKSKPKQKQIFVSCK